MSKKISVRNFVLDEEKQSEDGRLAEQGDKVKRLDHGSDGGESEAMTRMGEENSASLEHPTTVEQGRKGPHGGQR